MANLVRDIDPGEIRIREPGGVDSLLDGPPFVEPGDHEVLQRTAPVLDALYRNFRDEGEP